MGDYDQYAKALMAAAAGNEYSELGGLADTLATTAGQYAQQPGADRGEALLYAGVLGALGGGLGAYGRNTAARDYGLANQVMLGLTNERPKGLSGDLYKQALSYKDLVAANQLAERKANIIKEIDNRQIETDFIGRQEAAREIARRRNNLPLDALIGDKGRAGTVGASGGAVEGDEKKVGLEDVAEAQLDPVTDLKSVIPKARIADNIGARIAMMPTDQQDAARTELGKIQKMNDLLETVDETIETAYNNANYMQEVDNMLPFGWELPNLSSESRQRDAARTGIVAAVRPLWGSISADDIPVIIDSYMPKKGETRQEVEYKKAKLRQILVANTDPTPILQMNGLVDRPNVGIPIQGGADVMTPEQQIRAMAAEGKAMGLSEAETNQKIREFMQTQTIPTLSSGTPVG